MTTPTMTANTTSQPMIQNTARPLWWVPDAASIASGIGRARNPYMPPASCEGHVRVVSRWPILRYRHRRQPHRERTPTRGDRSRAAAEMPVPGGLRRDGGPVGVVWGSTCAGPGTTDGVVARRPGADATRHGCDVPSGAMAEPPLRDRTLRRLDSARPWLADAVLAAVVASAQVAGSYAVAAHRERTVTAGGLALLCVGASALVLRRKYPVVVLAITYATTFTYLVTQVHTAPVWLAVVVAFVTAVQKRKRAAALGFLVAGYVLFLWVPMLAGKHAPSATFAWALGTGLAALAGGSELWRLRSQRAAAIARGHRAELLRHATDERLRIARDLHDVVAHHISAINVQANTALHLVDRHPDRAVAALATINDVSKQVLVELRSILGVLRA